MWEYPYKIHKEMAFVCVESGNIHRCGSLCKDHTITKRREGCVCIFTGIVVSSQILLHYTRPSKNPHDKRDLNDHYIKMGSVGRKKSPSTRTNLNLNIPTQLVTDTLHSIFLGPERHHSYDVQKGRFFRQVCKYFKKNKDLPIIFTETNVKLFTLYKSFGSMLNPPMKKIIPQLTLLAKAIAIYWVTLKTSLARSPKTIGVFTAVCVSKLRTGYSVDNVVIFPKINWISYHAPADINFSGLHAGIQCRSMSHAWRKMQEKFICSKTNTPIHGMLFKLDIDI